jgi:hypothetical protein
LQRPARATLEANLQADLLTAIQRHVLQQQSDHALALTVGRGGVAPQAREVRCQRQDRAVLLVRQHVRVLLAAARVFLVRCAQGS